MKKITYLLLMASSMVFAQFPAPYCGPLTFTTNVEPITLVNFAGINNSTSALVGPDNGTTIVAHEDFTAMIGNVTAGNSYQITLKGNTDGNFTTKLRVYIDWNQNNNFTDLGESYDIGDIVNSTGEDAIQLVGNIVVPGTALGGNTRMRVVKRYNAYGTSCQTGTGFGQAEDYTLSVTAVAACLTGTNNPTTLITPSTCNGFTPTQVATNSKAGEYFTISVNSGQTYKFFSSVSSDYFTVSTDNGATAVTSGLQPLTWVSNVTGTVRVYLHLNSSCGTENVNRTTSVICGVACLSGTLYPSATYSVSICDGTTVNEIANNSWAGEYSNVNVFATNTYTFSSSVATDHITITSADGTTPFMVGTGSVSNFTPTADGVVRVYFHTNSTCGTENVNRTKNVVCTSSATVPNCASNPSPVNGATNISATATFNLTWDVPGSGSIPTSYDIYAGESQTNLSFLVNVTTTSLPNVGPIDSYNTTIYWKVVPKNAAGDAVGCTVWSFTTEAAPPAPTNNNCNGAISIALGGVFSDSPVVGSVNSATTTPNLVPTCQSNYGFDVWYTVVVPASGSLTIETKEADSNSLNDTVIEAFTGTCGALTSVGCNDDATTSNFMSLLSLNNMTPGSTIYIAVWKFNSSNPTPSSSQFKIAAYDSSLSNVNFESTNIIFYPNPVKDILHLSYDQSITHVEVFNLVGQKMISKNNSDSYSQVDLSNIASGVYLVQVTSNNATKTIRIIKE
jgi:hypothetical protein